jgi:hypothetical protein
MARREERACPTVCKRRATKPTGLHRWSDANLISERCLSVGAPDSRPRAAAEMAQAQAGPRKPARRREPSNGEQGHGSQPSEVRPAASTHSQSGGRAAHVTAKATLAAPGLEPRPAWLGERLPHRERGQAVHRDRPSRRGPTPQPARQRQGAESPTGTGPRMGTCLLRVLRAAPLAWNREVPGGCVMPPLDRPPESRVRETRTHGLNGGLAHSGSEARGK